MDYIESLVSVALFAIIILFAIPGVNSVTNFLVDATLSHKFETEISLQRYKRTQKERLVAFVLCIGIILICAKFIIALNS